MPPTIRLLLSSPSVPQANPADPDNFPFMVLGNKIDENGGASRQVRIGRAHMDMELGSSSWADAPLQVQCEATAHVLGAIVPQRPRKGQGGTETVHGLQEPMAGLSLLAVIACL